MTTIKRKALMCILVICFLASGLTACGKEAAMSEGKQQQYLEWTAQKWEEASDADKEECVHAYLQYLATEQGTQLDKETLDESIEVNKEVIEILLQSEDGKTLQNIVEEALDNANK